MHKQILRLAIPNIISNITIPLLGMADLAIMGHIDQDSDIYIGAIALGGVIFSVIYWTFSFLRMSTSGFTAQSYGERRLDKAANGLARSLSVSLGAGLILILLQWPIAEISFYFLKSSPELSQYAKDYYYIRIYAAPASLSLYAFYGWFVGMQNSKSPMIIALLINVLNTSFNLLFVFGFGLKSSGVAFGTVLAQYSGFALAAFIVWRYYGRILQKIDWSQIFNWQKLKYFFSVNTDILIRVLCVVILISFFTQQSAQLGDTTLAVNTILLQFFYLFSYFADGFAYAAEALVGKNIGAKNTIRLKQSIKYIFTWGLSIGGIVSLLYYTLGHHLLNLLTSNTKLINQAQEYMPWIWALPLLSFASFIWDGIYIGATASKAMRNTMLVSTFLFYYPSYFLLRDTMGNHALWLSFILFLLMRGILQTIIAPRAIYKLANPS